MYDTVLAPTDGSDVSLSAAQEAVELTSSDGTIHALAVLEDLPMHKQSGKGAKIEAKDRTDERAELEEAINRISEIAETAGVNSITAVTEGVPHLQILEYADENDVDAIVMGKRGLGAAVNDMLGSTTERVVRRAATTVITVPEP
jgi:nucleotide-binding universal stress UspA family protein